MLYPYSLTHYSVLAMTAMSDAISPTSSRHHSAVHKLAVKGLKNSAGLLRRITRRFAGKGTDPREPSGSGAKDERDAPWSTQPHNAVQGQPLQPEADDNAGPVDRNSLDTSSCEDVRCSTWSRRLTCALSAAHSTDSYRSIITPTDQAMVCAIPAFWFPRR